MKYIIDRFEENIAICEDDEKNRVEFARSLLPAQAREGSAILVDDSGMISCFEDSEREKRIAEKMKAVWR